MKLNNNNLIVDFFKNISAYVSNSPILYVFEIIIRFVAALATLILSVILIVKFAADTEEKRVSITYILIVVLRIFIFFDNKFNSVVFWPIWSIHENNWLRLWYNSVVNFSAFNVWNQIKKDSKNTFMPLLRLSNDFKN